MKKIITLLLAGLLLGTTVLFAACGTNNDESSTAASAAASSASPADGSSETETSSEAETSSEPEESTGIPAQDPAVEEIESYPMTLEMTSDTMFKMSCTDELGKPFSTTFTKKSWGTWNIADWIYDGTAFTGGSTDWEYVYRAGATASGWVWSGGNHGNEKLLSLEFYDGETDEKIELKKGEPVELNRIKIVEKTQLHLGDEDKTYCDVVRTYTVVGRQISLDVDYAFTEDTYFWLSYTCMFPINKKYGLYIDFKNNDGTTKTVETLEVGAADYSGAMYKNNAASVCEMYGKTNPSYRFYAEVFTIEDSLNNFANADKTFYWDMNTTHNKLYFSKFNESTPTKVAAGTEWHTSCRWTFVADYEAPETSGVASA